MLDAEGNKLSNTPLATTMSGTDGAFTLTIPQAQLAGEGFKQIGIQAVDQSSTAGNIALFDVILDATPPDAPNRPDLQDASDTGTSNFDNITAARSLAFNVGGVEPEATVQLFRQAGPSGTPTLVASTVAGAGVTTVVLTDPGTDLNSDGLPDGLSDGTYLYTARQIDAVGNQSLTDSPALEVIVTDTDPQADPTVPDLVGAEGATFSPAVEDSDTGVSDIDNITTDNTPTFLIRGQAGDRSPWSASPAARRRPATRPSAR